MIKNKWNNHKLAAESMAFLMVCLFLLFSFWNPVMSYAKDSFLAGYMQSVYNQKSGIGSNEVNCLFQSSSGYIWAGTDGGLVDGVIAEGDRCFSDIARMLEKELGILGRMKSKELVNSRYDKFRNIDRGEIK